MIRSAAVADVETIVSLERAIFGTDGWSSAQIEADVAAPLRHVAVAELDGAVVGYAVVAMAGDVADLLRIAVAESHRRSGVASALLDEVERLAAEAGADRIVLEVAASNAGAQEFYRDRGYVEMSRRRGYYRDGGDALVLMRALG
jgi:ribosomal-protein-alanine acetyltransferase